MSSKNLIASGVSIVALIGVTWYFSALFFAPEEVAFNRFRPVQKNGKSLVPNNYWDHVRGTMEGYDHALFVSRLEEAKVFIAQSALTRNFFLTQPWMQEGPGNIGGRFNVLTGDPGSSNVIYAGAANGGIFKTVDGGLTWTPIFDDMSYLAIGSIELDPNNSERIWVGTGDRNFGGTSQIGFGIYLSEDGGTNWAHKGLQETSIISDIQIDPGNSNRIFVGALGNTFAKTQHRGVYRTTDGGDTWERILFVSDSSGVCNLVMDPSNPNTLYACFFNRVNLPFLGRAFGPDAGIWKTTDGGDNWVKLTGGLPTGEHSRVGITISSSNPNLLYAVYVATDYNPVDVYRSTDGGLTWTPLNIYANGVPGNVMGGFGWYFGQIHINPYNNNHLILQGVDQYVSNDGGMSWQINVPTWDTYEVHADKHAVLFFGPTTYIIATDGGLYKTTNNGLTWTDIEDIPVTQFYHITVHPNINGLYGGGAQDNGSMSGNASMFSSWMRLFGGDGFRMTWLTDDPGGVYYEFQNGGLYYVNEDTFEFIDVSPSFSMGDRINWDMPYVVDEQNGVLYAGTHRILKMGNAPYGSYVPISPDLTKVSTGNYIGTASRYTITEVEQDPFNSNILYAGTTDGWVWRGEGTGTNYTWTNISTGLPERWVRSVRSSPNIPGTLYVTFSGYRLNDYAPYIYKSTNNGATWTPINGNLPNLAINDVLIMPGENDNRLFVATDGAVFFTEDGGENWQAVGTDIPVCTMTRLALDAPSKKLLVGTFSRSMFSYNIECLFESVNPVGLESNELSKILIYPNPAQDKITLTGSEEGSFAIYSLNGKLVEKGSLNTPKTAINISHLPQGTYLIQFNGKIEKFIKQ